MQFFYYRLLNFLQYVTGGVTARLNSIRIMFDEDVHGAIVVHTCSSNIILPKGAFKSESEYPRFKMAMDSCVISLKFNMV